MNKSSPSVSKKISGDEMRDTPSQIQPESAGSRALKITAIYFIVGCIWILATDTFVIRHFEELSKIRAYSTLKGLFYVLVTAGLIYYLIYKAMKRTLDGRNKIAEINKKLEKSNLSYQALNKELENKHALLKSIIDATPDLIFYKDTNSVYAGCNKAFEAFTGKTESELIGQTDFEIFPEAEASTFRTRDAETLSRKTFGINEERVTYPDGSLVYLETLKSPYFDAAGNIIGLIGVSRNITDRKSTERKIRYLIHHDPLTGLYNRAFLQEERDILDSAENLPLSVVIGDINGLKVINDAFGHDQGNEVLKEYAEIFTRHCPDGSIAVRIGGDEFLILMPKTDVGAAQAVVERIYSASRTLQSEDLRYADIALGHATKNTPDESLQDVLKTAEDAMYRRKLLDEKSLHSAVINSIKTAMLEKSNETEKHAERLAEYSKALGHRAGLSSEKIDDLELAATLHDIGKISIDKNILIKAEKLTDEDWNEIKKHPETGFRIAKAIPPLQHIAKYILCHHERWDGTGYPNGLAGEEIPVISRIISIVDAYDAMIQDRAYRKALTPEEAAAEILKNAGTQFDPVLARTFVEEVLES